MHGARSFDKHAARRLRGNLGGVNKLFDRGKPAGPRAESPHGLTHVFAHGKEPINALLLGVRADLFVKPRCVFAGFCGSLSYFLKVEEGHPFRWTEFILHTTISAVCGLITFEIMPPQVAGALCGMSGWMGTRLLRILEIVIRKKLGVTKEELK